MTTPAALLPANTTLLQPGTMAFRLSDALQMLNPNAGFVALQTAVAALQSQVATLQSQVTSLQSQMTTAQSEINSNGIAIANLQGDITTINQRLANAGIP